VVGYLAELHAASVTIEEYRAEEEVVGVPASEHAVTESALGAVGRPSRELAVLIVTGRRTDLLDRALASVDKWLPDAPIHVWANHSPASGEVADLSTDRPDVSWTFCESNLGYIVAMNRLMAQVPAADALQLDPEAELLGPLIRAREVLAQPGVAVVSPTVAVPEDALGRPWDVAHRRPTVLRSLVESAGYADELRTHGLSDLYPALPDEVDGYLARCSLLVSRDAWDALGPFDERFFGHGEDAAWQRTARKSGWSLRVVDEVEPQVRHTGTPSASDDPLARRQDELRRATRIMVLGNRRNVGRGGVYAAGDLVLERAQRRRRAPRREYRAGRGAQSGGRPEILVTTNGLDLGGAERQRVVLANELVERGHPVTMVALQKLGPYTAELDPRVRLLMRPFWQPLVDMATDESVVVGGVTNTEIAFAMGWRALGRATGQRRRWLPATHDPAELDKPTYSEAQARALRTADGLLVLARAHHEDLTRHQRLTHTVMVAPNGIPLAEARPYAPAASGGPVRFGMLTRIVEYKNPLLLIGALDALGRPDDWTLDIFGAGPDLDRLRARTPAHLSDRVRWRGRSSGPDEAFEDMDVLCVPSGFEAFPLVMVEAMVRGLPVMASLSGAIPEMLDDGRAGVQVDPLTRENWTEALRAVIDDPAGTAALGTAGRERAIAHYTVAAMVDDYQRAFAQVLGHPLPGAPEEPASLL
jgi:glycosyltransferase involved in cell wall biosynthesis/GT2 family glycosyltransferase